MGHRTRGAGRRIPGRVRRTTVLAGVALGPVLAAVLVLTGVVGVPRSGPPAAAPGAAPSTPDGPAIARQPELGTTLLDRTDLPAGFSPRPRPASTAPGRAGPAPAGPGRAGPATSGPDRTERCRTLFERPWDLATEPEDATESVTADHAHPTGALLRQASVRFAGDGAERAVGHLRTASGGCREFDARLDDGTAVTVRVGPLTLGRVADETYGLVLTARGAHGEVGGYLAVGRVGPVLSVLRHLGPAGTVDPARASPTLGRAVDKLLGLLRRLGRPPVTEAVTEPTGPRTASRRSARHRRGKMGTCRPCV
ncbi:hypothetical protein [Polymorphospora lycopeni]|uniref:Uncharacterized protein n=1 Tax=Polymorphospora lycopeni TaxID=3140240 RepID=A0ABV5CZS0_9ACTN